MLIDANGKLIKCEIFGKIEANSLLSGMPNCKLGLNDKAISELEGENNTNKDTDSAS